MSRDIFRPYRKPAKTLYDAFQKEASKRSGRSIEEWMLAERLALWYAARDYAQQQGLRVLTMTEVEQAGSSACGHIDYGAKWVYGVVDAMNRPAKKEEFCQRASELGFTEAVDIARRRSGKKEQP